MLQIASGIGGGHSEKSDLNRLPDRPDQAQRKERNDHAEE
jgi:hypothetical protein